MLIDMVSIFESSNNEGHRALAAVLLRGIVLRESFILDSLSVGYLLHYEKCADNITVRRLRHVSSTRLELYALRVCESCSTKVSTYRYIDCVILRCLAESILSGRLVESRRLARTTKQSTDNGGVPQSQRSTIAVFFDRQTCRCIDTFPLIPHYVYSYVAEYIGPFLLDNIEVVWNMIAPYVAGPASSLAQMPLNTRVHAVSALVSLLHEASVDSLTPTSHGGTGQVITVYVYNNCLL
jgi:hypothetical protein